MKPLKTAGIFTGNMVLQRDKHIKIWGTAEEGDLVTVTLNGRRGRTRADGQQWMAVLPAMPAGGPYVLKVTDGKDILEFQNVMIGEVWLAGGQSNMELELKDSRDGRKAAEQGENSRIRYYNTPRLSYMDGEFEEKAAGSSWQEGKPDNTGSWSAVAYYFAKRLEEELQVPVGIIGCNWGGTSTSNWISRQELELDKDTNTYVEEYDRINEGRSPEEYLRELEEYQVYFDRWEREVNRLYAENPELPWSRVLKTAGENRWPGPIGPRSPFRPGGLYETMLKRVMPYTLRGFLYYQGESDDHKPEIYDKLMMKLIGQWRKDWEEEELPFLMVQLPMFFGSDVEEKRSWPLLRENQMRVHKLLKNTGIAVILDCGEYGNIHPADKEPVGIRLALQALYHVYGRNIEAYGPLYRSMAYKDNGIELAFDHAQDGIERKGERAEGFEIAGADRIFLPAEAEIRGNKILVWAQRVPEPEYVRYAWVNYGPVTLFNKAGLPMAPFRTSRKDEIS